MIKNQTESLNSMIFRKDKHLTPTEYMYDYKVLYITKFKQAHLADPKVRKRALCNKIGLSERTLDRYMKDVGYPSFYRTPKTNIKAENEPTNKRNRKGGKHTSVEDDPSKAIKQ